MSRAGIIGSGLFLGMASVAIVGSDDGVRILRRASSKSFFN
jgi:hypothetical protein